VEASNSASSSAGPSSSIRLSLWDTAGQEEYDKLRQMCYSSKAMKGPPSGAPASPAASSSPVSSFAHKGGQGGGGTFDVGVFVVCFAWNNPQSFTNVELKWYRELKKLASELSAGAGGAARGPASPQKAARPFSIVLVATKSDLRREADDAAAAAGTPFVKGFISRTQASDLQRSIKADAFVECSAKTGEGVRDVFQQAMQMWYQQQFPPTDAAKGKGCTML
jgi:GTPase SAR1 family protein